MFENSDDEWDGIPSNTPFNGPHKEQPKEQVKDEDDLVKDLQRLTLNEWWNRCVQPIRASSDGWYSCVDIMKELGSKSSVKFMNSKMRRFSVLHGIDTEEKPVSKTWISKLGQWKESQSKSPCLMVPGSAVPALVSWSLSTSRKTKSEQSLLLERFGMGSEALTRVPIELLLVEELENTCPWIIKRQWYLDKWKMDVYIPDVKIAIQIDENGHGSYDGDDEKQMEQSLRSHGIVLFRFNPDLPLEKDDHVCQRFIREVWRMTACPAVRQHMQRSLDS